MVRMHYWGARPSWLRIHTDRMPDATQDQPVVLNVPASGRYLEIIRTTVGRMARLAEFTFDGIEDMALAVDEAAVLLIESGPTTLELSIQLTGHGLNVQVTAFGFDAPWPPAGLETDTRWLVLSTLCEDSWLFTDPHPGIGLAQASR